MSVAWNVEDVWGEMKLESHDEAWEQAKRILKVQDVRDLTVQQFREVLYTAEQIRKFKSEETL
jgi:hypothetical protein